MLIFKQRSQLDDEVPFELPLTDTSRCDVVRSGKILPGFIMRWSRLFGQIGGEVKLIPAEIMPPVWSSDHGGHAPHDLFR